MSESESTRRARQRGFWAARYRADPAFFGRGPSPFVRWAEPWLRRRRVRTVLELGAGYGRDLGYLLRRGYDARGVESVLAGVRSGRAALSRLRGVGSPERCLLHGEGGSWLRRLPPGSLDAVYSNLCLNMDFTTAEHRRLLTSVHRALRDGGLHLYSVRSVNDPWYGRGRRVGRDLFDPAPQGTTMHFFSPEYVRSLARGRFRVLALEEHAEGGTSFPTKVLYVAEEKATPRRSAKGDIPPLPGRRP